MIPQPLCLQYNLSSIPPRYPQPLHIEPALYDEHYLSDSLILTTTYTTGVRYFAPLSSTPYRTCVVRPPLFCSFHQSSPGPYNCGSIFSCSLPGHVEPLLYDTVYIADSTYDKTTTIPFVQHTSLPRYPRTSLATTALSH